VELDPISIVSTNRYVYVCILLSTVIGDYRYRFEGELNAYRLEQFCCSAVLAPYLKNCNIDVMTMIVRNSRCLTLLFFVLFDSILTRPLIWSPWRFLAWPNTILDKKNYWFNEVMVALNRGE
jgi:hypothetical protein